MPRKPSMVARVACLERSQEFYRDVLGLKMNTVAQDAAIVEPDSWPLLLAGPGAADLSQHLADPHETVKPGATVHRFSRDIYALARHIQEHGAEPVIHETDWGDRTLTLTDPDGYSVCFWTSPYRSVEQTVALYAAGPDALEAAIAGLSEAEITWKPEPDEWSIREIVHHVADSDATALFRVKLALAEPGRVMLGNPYHPDTWARSLDYADRDTAPALALLRATRLHILQLLDHLPDAMQRTVRNPEGEETAVETFISMLASHLMIHIEQIDAVREQWTAR